MKMKNLCFAFQHDPDVDAIYRLTSPLPLDFNSERQKNAIVCGCSTVVITPEPKNVNSIYRTLQRKTHNHNIFSYCCLFVVCSGPATDDKHCFDCLLVVSTINLLGPGRTPPRGPPCNGVNTKMLSLWCPVMMVTKKLDNVQKNGFRAKKCNFGPNICIFLTPHPYNLIRKIGS